MLTPALLLIALLAAPMDSAPPAAGALLFPAPLQGTWNPAPYDCDVAPEAENDMRFEVSGPYRMNYEDVETAISIVEVPGTLQAWRLTTSSNVLGDEEGQSRIYVLGRKYLFVTDGDRMDRYLQCK